MLSEGEHALQVDRVEKGVEAVVHIHIGVLAIVQTGAPKTRFV